MDESFQEFEIELKTLFPRRPAPRIMDRIASELAAVEGKPSLAETCKVKPGDRFIVWRWLSMGAVGIATAFAIFFTASRQRGVNPSEIPSARRTVAQTNAPVDARAEPPVSDNAYKPVAAANILYEMKNGPILATGDNAERRVRYRYVDTYTWKNPRTNASLTWSVPRDEIRLQAVQFN